MTRFLTQTLSGTALATGMALCAAALPGTASAQNTGNGVSDTAAPGTGDDEKGDIIVTARKRSEDIQTVPIAITAFTAEDLAKRNISNFNDLANSTPGVSITSIAGGNVQNIYLRGVAPANTANDLNVEANVGVFIDGIYQTSRNTLDMISVLDVGQIEIAKGPQSALFGRSTFAGALSIQTKRPARTLSGSLSATAGQDKDYRVRGSISTPIGGSGLYLRVGGGYVTYDGYGKNAANTSDNLGGTKKYAGTASLEFSPTPDFTARLSGFFTHSESELTPETLLPITAFNCGTTTTSPLAGASVASPRGQLFCGTLQANKVSSLSPGVPDTVAQTRQVSLSLEGKLDGVRVVSLTGYTAAENRAFNDYDGSAAGTVFGVCGGGSACVGAPNYTRLVNANLHSTSVERVRTFSQEVRLQSDNDSPFSWLFGGAYFDQRIPVAAGGIGTDLAGLAPNERFVAVNPINPASTGGAPNAAYEFTANPFTVSDANASQLFGSYSQSSTSTMSIFGSLGYKFGNLRINAEGRYNIDRKRAQVFSISNPLSQPGINQPIAGTSVPATGTFPTAGPLFARTFEHFAPRVTIDFQATPDVFFYASAAKGYRSGGFNTANAVSATGILASEVAYDEESNWTYEAGFKTNLFDRRLLLNGSVFRVDWSNAQVSAFTQNPTAVNPVRIVQNAGNIRVWGVEGQAELKLTDVFNVGGSFNYSDPKFRSGAYDGGAVTQCVIGTGATATAAPGCPPVIVVTTPSGAVRAVPSLAGLRPQRAVKWQWNAHAGFDIPLSGDWKATGRVDVTYTGPAYNNLVNTVEFGKRTLTNARLGFENNNYSIVVWANNLFDKTYVVNSINQPRAGYPFAYSIPEIYLGEGRRIGVTATAKF